jgi:hypothetical protein
MVVWLRLISFTSGLGCGSAVVNGGLGLGLRGCGAFFLRTATYPFASGGFGLCAILNKISTKFCLMILMRDVYEPFLLYALGPSPKYSATALSGQAVVAAYS